MKLLFALFLFPFLVFSSCEKNDTAFDGPTGSLQGNITLIEGNCMPPGPNDCQRGPIATIIFVTSPSEEFNPDLLIASTESNNDGSYTMTLPVGEFSLFLRDGDAVTCTVTSCPDNCFCQLITIEENQATTLDAEIDHAVW